MRTIEEDLIQAVYKAGAISEDMRDNLGKVFTMMRYRLHDLHQHTDVFPTMC